MRGGAFARAVPLVSLVFCAFAASASAGTFSFSTGNPDGKMALGSRPSTTGQEIEAADDFVLSDATSLKGAKFTGLLPSATPASGVQQVRIEIFRTFPSDSDVGRTSGPPTFSTSEVPTRVNSPSDTDLQARDSADGGLTFVVAVTSSSFSAFNSVLTGINPKPNQTTGGDGFVSGEEVSFDVSFTAPLDLAAGHYFFVPQVKLASGNFLWLSAPKPIAAPGTPFPAGSTDLQAWIRNHALEPDWLRVGTDIVGGTTPPTFNGTFSLSGSTCQPISLSPASLPDATAGQPYSASFSASGGVAPYSFSEMGALPAGLALDTSGKLSGAPEGGGSFPITVTATDANGCTGSEDLTLTVAQAPAGGTPLEPVTPAAPSPPPLPPAISSAPLPPAISSARLTPKTFRAAASGATLARRRRVPASSIVTYSDSRAATTTFTVLKPAVGHKRGAKCVAGRPRKHQKRCTRWLPAGSATHVDLAGAVKVRFSGRVHSRRLAPGGYRLMLTPRASGLTGRSVTLAFRIVR